ncbi:hypothetical protein RvY_10816 [Ramazzottius varieornatus]|uniref:Uncharacterized protein n=1 Tax=Ramazzottius varieornatus TaxID=947166 RepID=A0A1D1VN00_RAMVA|nr:hypothetical protein RvY_10816 [Ramazzottius varieornatus]
MKRTMVRFVGKLSGLEQRCSVRHSGHLIWFLTQSNSPKKQICSGFREFSLLRISLSSFIPGKRLRRIRFELVRYAGSERRRSADTAAFWVHGSGPYRCSRSLALPDHPNPDVVSQQLVAPELSSWLLLWLQQPSLPLSFSFLGRFRHFLHHTAPHGDSFFFSFNNSQT